MFTFTFFGRVVEFYAGIVLALIFLNNKQLYIRKYCTYIGFFGLLIVLLLITQVPFVANRYALMYFFKSYVSSFFVAYLLYGLIKEKTFLKRLLENKPMVLFGKSSYIFYLIHMGVFEMWISKNISKQGIIIFIVLNALSVALYYSLENPLNHVIRRWYRNRATGKFRESLPNPR